ncbi:MAG TPA: helix-turn-helix domain-containing protein [Solirubrobacteraceae bacterium]|jgi:hypothetical protein|nr:helix-turn-helix domain-containing protein [Solirubrobacteraceae bacterium]
MASRPPDRITGAAAIVARIQPVEAAREMAAEFASQMSAFEHLSDESRADVVTGVQRSLRRLGRFLSTGVMAPDADFDPLREWARARATEGVRLEDLLRSFGLAHQVGWQLLRRHARSDETEVLLELAAPLARYVDQVCTVVTETYLAERELLVSEEERRARSLVERLSLDTPLEAGESELADRLGVPLQDSYAPFAIVLPGRPPHNHAALAARLRRAGWRLAITQSDCVVGVTWKQLELADLGEAEAILAIAEATPRALLGDAREDVAVLAEHARRIGLTGRLSAEDHIPEILLGRSPVLAARLRTKVLGSLGEEDRGELARSLRTMIACRLDRTAASRALHVHRNTLAYRLKRIEEITGLDLSDPRDLACVYLALAGDVPAGPHRQRLGT